MRVSGSALGVGPPSPAPGAAPRRPPGEALWLLGFPLRALAGYASPAAAGEA